MKRSKRFQALDARPVNLDGYIGEWPEMGFVAMHSPYDPTPSIKIVGGKVVELDGKKRADFDFIDTFIADYAINLQRAPVSMSVLRYDNATQTQARDAGANSARVIKRLPFKLEE